MLELWVLGLIRANEICFKILNLLVYGFMSMIFFQNDTLSNKWNLLKDTCKKTLERVMTIDYIQRRTTSLKKWVGLAVSCYWHSSATLNRLYSESSNEPFCDTKENNK